MFRKTQELFLQIASNVIGVNPSVEIRLVNDLQAQEHGQRCAGGLSNVTTSTLKLEYIGKSLKEKECLKVCK